MTSLVELSEVRKAYNGHRESVALDSISLTVPARQAACVMGPSGSGKSTLLNIIGGLDRPSTGPIKVAGLNLGKMGEAAPPPLRLTKVGPATPQFHHLPSPSPLHISS